MVNRPRLAAWRVEADGPTRVEFSDFELERKLEDWIERDPSIVMHGLQIVGRQVIVDAGRLDLLAVDPAGRWIVIELKAGELHREVMAQALDYAACIRALPSDRLSALVNEYRRQVLSGDATHDDELTNIPAPPRDVLVIVVGTATDAGVERLADYLSSAGVEVRAVTLHALTLGSEGPVLIRQLTDADVPSPAPDTPGPPPSLESLIASAVDARAESLVRRLNDVAVGLGLYPRQWPNAIMYCPPQHHGRCLFTLWPKASAMRRFWAGSDVFSEYFDVSITQAREALGVEGWRELTDETVNDYTRGLQALLTGAQAGSSGGGVDSP